MRIIPPDPDFESPLLIATEPELPELAVPVLSCSDPLTPDRPAFAVDKRIDPLVDFDPIPLVTYTLPPVADVDSPDETNTDPPAPLSPDPT